MPKTSKTPLPLASQGALEVLDASVSSLRITKIRDDYDPARHGDDLYAFNDHAFVCGDGTPLPNSGAGGTTATLDYTGFDEPFSGVAFTLNILQSADASREHNFTLSFEERMDMSDWVWVNKVGRVADDAKPNAEKQVALALTSFISEPCAEAIAKIADVAWGFSHDADDIVEEGFDRLRGVVCRHEMGADLIAVYPEEDWAGGVFVEFSVYAGIPRLSITAEGRLDPEGIVNWEDHKKRHRYFRVRRQDQRSQNQKNQVMRPMHQKAESVDFLSFTEVCKGLAGVLLQQ